LPRLTFGQVRLKIPVAAGFSLRLMERAKQRKLKLAPTDIFI